jgi:SAM-dependent methyltransferase
MVSSARYTHGHAESVLRSHRTRTAENSAAYLLPELRAGLSLLDVGSGPGTITADLAERVAPGRVTALETSEAVLQHTRDEVARRGCGLVDFAVGDVLALDYPAATFDIVHAHQVLQHVQDPVAALREMVRVCRPGGLVAARDGDYGGFIWYPQNPGLDRWNELYHLAARQRRRARRGASPPGLGQGRGLPERAGVLVNLVLRRSGQPRRLGRYLGRPDHRLRHRRPADQLRAGHRG